MKIYRPDPKLVNLFVNIKPNPKVTLNNFRAKFIHPADWYDNHRSFVLQELLPTIQPPIHVWKAVAEGYLTDVEFDDVHSDLSTYVYAYSVFPKRKYSFEQVLCDGSSLVPDIAYQWGRIKDPWAVGHDIIYMLNRHKLPDVYGKRWSRWLTDIMYRDGWYAQKNYIVGTIWWSGLVIGGWFPWNIIKANCKPECKEFINNNIPLCEKCRIDYTLGKYNPCIICKSCVNYWKNGVE